MNFEELQQAWQKQEAPAAEKPENFPAGNEPTLDQVKKLQRKVMVSNIMMSVCLVFTCVFYVYLWRNIQSQTIWFDLGMTVVFCAMILTGALVWLRSIPWGNLKPNLSSREYIKQALQSFRFRRSTLKIVMPIYMFLLYLGINFIYLDIFRDGSLQTRIWVHLGLTVFMILLGGLSLFYHRRKYDNDFDPVVKELEALQKEFEE